MSSNSRVFKDFNPDNSKTAKNSKNSQVMHSSNVYKVKIDLNLNEPVLNHNRNYESRKMIKINTETSLKTENTVMQNA